MVLAVLPRGDRKGVAPMVLVHPKGAALKAVVRVLAALPRAVRKDAAPMVLARPKGAVPKAVDRVQVVLPRAVRKGAVQAVLDPGRRPAQACLAQNCWSGLLRFGSMQSNKFAA